MSFASGENVGPYRIVEQLGSGGMATVFKAYHASLDRYVAIKVLHPAFKQDPNFLSRFQREARIVAKLQHPAIVPVYDFNEHNGQPYLVMRFIEGETLKARLVKGELPLHEVLRIMRPVCEALAYAHQQGVLHRDVKPSNVLLTPQGGVFLADFGLARIAQAGESTLSQDTMVGTPQYISPEQARGDADLDARTDIYSLGVVLYELLVGRVPYQADTPYAVIHDHIFTPLPMPHSIKPGFPEALERVLLKALAKERGDRYASVTDLIAAFEQAAQNVISSVPTQVAAPAIIPAAVSQPIAPATTSPAAPASESTTPSSAAPKRSNKAMWIGLAIGLVAIGAVAILIVAGRGQQAAPPPPASTPIEQPNQPGLPNQPAQPDPVNALRQSFANANDLAGTGHPDQARAEFRRTAVQAEKALLDNPNLPPDQRAQLHTLAGQSWLALGQPEPAQNHFENLAQILPDNPDVLVGLSAALLMRGRQDQATVTLDRAQRLNPDLLGVHLIRACLLLKQNEPLRAVSEYRLAAGPDGNVVMPPWTRMALVALDCGDNRFN